MDNEAPVVMFTNYKRSDGFEVSLTLRGNDLMQVATDLDSAIKLIKEAGGTPVTRSFAKPSQTPQNGQEETRMCSEHQVPMKKKISKNTNKPYFSHSKKNEDDSWSTCFGKGWQ